MTPEQQRREWRKLSILGWILALVVVNSFFGGALLFDFTADYFAQAFGNAPVDRLFDHPTPDQYAFLMPIMALLEAGFFFGAMFVTIRTQLFVSRDRLVLRNLLLNLCYISLVLSCVIVIFNTSAEFFTDNDRDWRLLSKLAVTCQYFYVFIFSMEGIGFSWYLYRARIVPSMLALITLTFDMLAFAVNLLMLNTNLPTVRLTGGITFLTAEIMLWSGVLWYWSRPIRMYDDNTVRVTKTQETL